MPVAPERFDATQITSSSVNLRGTVSGTSLYSSKAVYMGFFTGGELHIQVILPENPSNRPPVLCSLVIREETPSPLHIGCLTDGLPQLTRQYPVVIASSDRLIPILSSSGGSSLPGYPFHLRISYLACVDTPIPEVHPPGDPGPDLPGPVDTRRFREDNVGKDKGLL